MAAVIAETNEVLAPPPVDSVVVETLDSHGRVSARERIALTESKRGFTIGRGANAEVMVDDAHAAPLHAMVEVAEDGSMHVTDLGSLNGVIAGSQRHAGVQQLPLPDGRLQIGRTHLRLRTARETLPAEKPDRAGLAGSGKLSARIVLRMVLAGGLLCLAYTGYSVWLEAPRDFAPAFVGAMLSILAGMALWAAIWGLLSRVLQGEWRWLTHLAIPLSIVAGLLVLDFAFDLAWFTLDLRLPRLHEIVLVVAALALLLFLHLVNATAIARRRAAIIAVLLPTLVVGATQWVAARGQARNVNYTGDAVQVLPPAFRLRPGMAADEYFSQARQLREAADKRRKALPYKDAEGDEDDE